MDKIAINPSRLQWCMSALDMDINHLSSETKIAKDTLDLAMKSQETLSVRQIEKIAQYFRRSLLFFLDPYEIREDKIYSPQFRTINNQKPIKSLKLRALIERVEKQRQIYHGLLEDLGEPAKKNWHPNFDWKSSSIKNISSGVREWLELPASYNFDTLRQAVEDKGIMVIVSNGYNGKWQIEKKNPVRGFSLYYEITPIVVIKKQVSKGAQAFTLMHELAHLLLHKESAIDNEEDFHNYQGKEKEANEFAGNLLIPDTFLKKINLSKLLSLDANQYDNFLDDFKKTWCVSTEAILIRLLINKKITQQQYEGYKVFNDERILNVKKVKVDKIPRTYRHREPINVFGKPFVYAVFDALHNKDITLAKASTYLDNLKISDIRQLEHYV